MAVVLRGADVGHLSLLLTLGAEGARFDGEFIGGDGGAKAWWRKHRSSYTVASCPAFGFWLIAVWEIENETSSYSHTSKTNGRRGAWR
jgi:hypothetical protein